MNEAKKEAKKHEVEKVRPRGMTPFERFDLFGDDGFTKEMDRFFHEYFPRRWWHQFHLGWPGRSGARAMEPFLGKTPSVDILDREEDFLIKAELPGVEKKDISISLANNMLTLEASMGKEEKEEKGEYYRREICSGMFRRVIDLPEPVKEEEAKATFKNGILELVVPKVAKAKRTTVKVD
ncbi:MAG: Hsp20/alpha crystallin family protein [Desulforhopalus sp.]|jgi:HSP20 family protein|nr:Hsp20/alpha crystallin family protein [Desulforhopalus sp.]